MIKECQYQKINIAEGINLNVITTDKFKTNSLSINFITPLDASTAGLNAMIFSVLKRGSADHPTMADINLRLDDLYASSIAARVQKIGEAQVFGLTSNFLDNCYALDQSDILGGVLDMMASILFHPLLPGGVFKPDYVESEKVNLKDSILSKLNNKTTYAIIRCHEEMCKDERFGISELGDITSVDEITSQSLTDRYRTVTENAPIEIYFIGNCDIQALQKKLTAIFAGRARKNASFPATQVVRRAGKTKEITEEMPVSQGKLTLGFRTDCVIADGNYAQFALFNEVYGGSPISKLFENVRERLSLCYYCRSMPDAQKGIMVVTCGIEVENREKAYDEILAQLEHIKNHSITDDEIEFAKKSLYNGYSEMYDDAYALEGWYLRRNLAGGVLVSPLQTASQAGEVTREQIAAVAQKITLDTVYFLKGTSIAQDAE